MLVAACASGAAPTSQASQTVAPAPEPLYVMDRTADPGDPSYVWLPKAVDRRPVVQAMPGTTAMDSLKRLGIRGYARLSYVVDTLGRVEAHSIHVTTTDHPALVAPATAVVQRIVYRPGRVRGKAVRVLMTITMGIRGSGH